VGDVFLSIPQIMSKKLVYIAGPFRAASQWRQEQNIRRAEEVALEVWRAGGVAICPHLNTRFFGGELPDQAWLDGDLEILRRCDALVTVDGWKSSEGAVAEVNFAETSGIPVFYSSYYESFKQFLVGGWE
jgi:hypothetical protein